MLIFIQDFKDREVHILLFVVLFVLNLGVFYHQNFPPINLLYNFLFLGTVFLVSKVYFSFRAINLEDDLKYGGMAIGDVVFFVVTIPVLEFHDYCFYFITGMVFSLVLHLLVSYVNKEKSVPLAGYMAIYLIFFVAMKNQFFNVLG